MNCATCGHPHDEHETMIGKVIAPCNHFDVTQGKRTNCICYNFVRPKVTFEPVISHDTTSWIEFDPESAWDTR